MISHVHNRFTKGTQFLIPECRNGGIRGSGTEFL
jgi:hypothetical protein